MQAISSSLQVVHLLCEIQCLRFLGYVHPALEPVLELAKPSSACKDLALDNDLHTDRGQGEGLERTRKV